MTINKLNKILSMLIAAGHGRKEVCVDKSKCNHPLESDGALIIPVTSAEYESHEMLNDDGGWAFKRDGTVKTRTALVISAEN